MSIPSRLSSHLEQRGACFEVCVHEHSRGSARTARIDDALEASEFVYIEGGDHECLLRMSHDQFHELMRAARHGRFCGDPVH